MSEIRVDTEPDAIENQIEDDMRLGLLLATQAGQFLAQSISQQMRERERDTRGQTERARAELEAHRAAALATTRGAGEQDWWARSTPAETARAWQVARGWEEHDPQMAERAANIREGLADRYGINDPDRLTVQDLVNAARDERAAHVASPLDQAVWEEHESGRYGDELAAQREDLLREVSAGTNSPGGRNDLGQGQGYQFVAGEDGTTVHDRAEWVESRIDALDSVEREARLVQRHAEDRGDRLRAHGAAPATGQDWEQAWDTVERRQGLRDRLQEAGVPADAVRGRMAAETAQGRPPVDAVRTPPEKGRRPRQRPAPQRQRQAERGR